jgi:amidase
MTSGRYTARQLTDLYLKRIEEIDRDGPELRSVIEVNPDAGSIADALDAERQTKAPGARSTGFRCSSRTTSIRPIACRPPRVRWRSKGNPLGGCLPGAAAPGRRRRHSRQDEPERVGELPIHAFVERLERSRRSGQEPLCAGSEPVRFQFGDRCGDCRKPRRDWRRNRDGRIHCLPSGANGLVGIKPTLGLISRTGIVPIAHSQDTAGPMARTVADAVALLNVMTASIQPTRTRCGAGHTLNATTPHL